MKSLAVFFAFLATPAFAHIGHLGEVAGHGHLIAAGALGAAALAAWLAAKGGGKKAGEAAEPEGKEDAEEASA